MCSTALTTAGCWLSARYSEVVPHRCAPAATAFRAGTTHLDRGFLLVLANQAVSYLTGDADAVKLNYECGRDGCRSRCRPRCADPFTLTNLRTGVAVTLTRPEAGAVLRITPERASSPAPYKLAAAEDWETGFSLNVSEGECQLDRVPKEQIEQLFGPRIGAGDRGDGRPAQAAGRPVGRQPVPLSPWLMILLLLALAVENLLANRFYRREPQPGEAEKKT